ncbi:MAG: HNH endonuclease [Chloroflexi bacterium]|nr:HNH endonuclease [Chloroflexota bacterium]
MEQESSGVISSKSQISYDYATIKITKSRIDRGLVAFPRSLAKYFPARNKMIQVYLDDATTFQPKQYSSYTSSTREGRIGGLKEWLQKNSIRSNDEIVIQFLDREHYVYRLIPERDFIVRTQELQESLDSSLSDDEASSSVADLVKWIRLDKAEVISNEYDRLLNAFPTQIERRFAVRRLGRARESAPPNVRTLLEEIYRGHCQICDFWFLKEDKRPYFEIHHLNPAKGHHPRNLLVVCGNCHNQFEYANVKHEFDNEWLVGVSFNERFYAVKQVALKVAREFRKTLFV